VPTPASAPLPDTFGHLDPARVLDALSSVGLEGDGRVLTLNSYENRVFLAHLDDGQAVVAKFYRPGRWTDAQILEEHAFAQELAAAEVPVVPPRRLAAVAHATDVCQAIGEAGASDGTLFSYRRDGRVDRFAVADRRAGRSPELEEPEVLRWIGRFIGRLHAVGPRRLFEHRRTLGVASFGEDSMATLLDGRFVADEARAVWSDAAERALAAVRTAFDVTGPVESIRLHGDCHVGNILWTAAGPHFVDLDDAVNGPAVQDLWMLLSGDRAARTAQLSEVIDGYETFRPFPPRELHLLEAMRALRILHYSAWIARRWSDPAFPAAFPWFGTPQYWIDQATRLRDQVKAIEDGPLPVFGPI
jgi:Ser/Thr protein kinase RdoA (MazF antagonist)